MRAKILTFLVLFVLPLATAVGDKPRTWTDTTGQFSVEAELVDVDGDSVKLRRNDGSIISVPLTKFSAEDKQYLAKLPKVLEGEVISVADGDTFTVLDAGRQSFRIRLEGIDSPEDSQAFSDKSKEALVALVFRKQVRIEWVEKDRYGRTLGHVYVGDKWVNHELIKDGWAWHYKKYNSDPRLSLAERKAAESRSGLWAEAEPIAPWDYRDGVRPDVPATNPYAVQGLFDPGQRAASNPSPRGPPETSRSGVGSGMPASSAIGATVYVTKTGEKYHLGGCRYLSKSKIPISLGEAQRQYSPCSVCRPPG